MPQRFIPFVNGQIYHIFNRGVEKRRIFDKERDYQKFINTLSYYQLKGPKPKLSNSFNFRALNAGNSKKIVEILAYCLMLNHFHLLVKQVEDGGITELITKTELSYTKYYNIKNNRVGPLFQGQFKAVLVESDEQLIHISRYIHLNPITSFLVKKLDQYKWSSYDEYINRAKTICSTSEVLGLFKNSKDYEKFVLDQVSYGQSLELIKHQIIEKF